MMLTSFTAAGDVPACAWCDAPLAERRSDARFCSRRCRQSAFRIRRRRLAELRAEKVLSFAYADPPYPGFARKLYGREEVDHGALVSSLVDRYDGWALSTSAAALRAVLPLCPTEARVCAWVKPTGVSSRTRGLHNAWEPVIVVPGRRRRPGKRDWLAAQPARGNGSLMGRKPEAFCCWLFELLGMAPGDRFDDLFPGSGIVGRCWREWSRTAAGDGCEGSNHGRRR